MIGLFGKLIRTALEDSSVPLNRFAVCYTAREWLLDHNESSSNANTRELDFIHVKSGAK